MRTSHAQENNDNQTKHTSAALNDESHTNYKNTKKSRKKNATNVAKGEIHHRSTSKHIRTGQKEALMESIEWLQNNDVGLENLDTNVVNILTKMANIPMPHQLTCRTKKAAMEYALYWLRTNEPYLDKIYDADVEAVVNLTGRQRSEAETRKPMDSYDEENQFIGITDRVAESRTAKRSDKIPSHLRDSDRVGSRSTVASRIHDIETTETTVAESSDPSGIALAGLDNDIESATSGKALLTATATKVSKNAKVGIEMKLVNGKIFISDISKDSIFKGQLPVGCELVSINGVSARNSRPRLMAEVIRTAESTVTVVAKEKGESANRRNSFFRLEGDVERANSGAELLTATAVKKSKDMKTGIKMKQDNTAIIISDISDDSIFYGQLPVGCEVVSINGVSARYSHPNLMTEVIKNAESKVTITAKKDELHTATVTKKHKNMMTGISMTLVNGIVTISNINEDSIFQGLLPVGSEVVSVNGVSARDSHPTLMAEVIKKAESSVTVIAKEEKLLTATAEKNRKDMKTGIRMKQESAIIYISDISGDSIFKGLLPVGCELVSINGVSARYSHPQLMGDVIRNAESTITVIVKERASLQEGDNEPTAGDVPPGVKPGGVWGTFKYIGGITVALCILGCFCLGILGFGIFCCPLDQRKAYKVDGVIYDAEGRYLASDTVHFIEDGIETPSQAFQICVSLCAIFIGALLAFVMTSSLH